jgi:hypothetical protein
MKTLKTAIQAAGAAHEGSRSHSQEPEVNPTTNRGAEMLLGCGIRQTGWRKSSLWTKIS